MALLGRGRGRVFGILTHFFSLDSLLSSERALYSVSLWRSAPGCPTSNSNVHNCVNYPALSNTTPVHTWKLEVMFDIFSCFICVSLPPHFQACPIKYSRWNFPLLSLSTKWRNTEMVNAENSEVLKEGRRTTRRKELDPWVIM